MAEWFKPRIREFLEKNKKEQSDEIKEIFGSELGYEIFIQKLKEIFGEVDEIRTAERKLNKLR